MCLLCDPLCLLHEIWNGLTAGSVFAAAAKRLHACLLAAWLLGSWPLRLQAGLACLDRRAASLGTGLLVWALFFAFTAASAFPHAALTLDAGVRECRPSRH